MLRAMQLHVDALFERDSRAPSYLLRTNEWDARPAPWVFLGRTSAGNLWRFRTGLAHQAVRALAEVCQREPVLAEPSALPLCAEALAAVLRAHGIAATPRSGPAFWLPMCAAPVMPAAGPAPVHVLPLLPDDAFRLHGGLDDWTADLPHRQPMFGAVPVQPGGTSEVATAVAVCASVRITPAAHEAGVETLPMARGQGHARRLVATWAGAVRARGALPMYSTDWDNLASRRVAAALGAVCFGVDFQLAG